ncbi:MAG: PAS domain S-box protein, partial [Alphaproteobacteria bacterium]
KHRRRPVPMGPDHNKPDAPTFLRLGDQLTRSLVSTATLLAIASLFACWFGTRAVVDGIVNYEGRETSRQWTVAFAHTLSQSKDEQSNDLMQPYKGGSAPERFKALDDAVFDGQILRYRIVNMAGAIVAASDFQEIGKNIAASRYWKYVEQGETHGYVFHLEPEENVDGVSALSHAITPLAWQGEQRGAIGIEADVSARVKQLNRLRYIAFGALIGLLAGVIGILGLSIARALNHQRLTQLNIVRSERQYRLLLDGTPDSIVIHDQEQVLYANDAAAVLHGAESREAMIGLDPMLLVPADKRSAVLANRREALGKGEIRKTETVGRRRLDGVVVETDSMGIPIEWDGKQCLLVQSRDMSKQRETQREIACREAQLSAFMENMQAMMFMTDTDHRMTLVNPRFEEFHGVKSRDIVGKTAEDWAPSEIAAQFRAQDQEVIESGIPMSWESSATDQNGKTTIIRDDVFPIRDDDENIIGLGGISTDITNDRLREEDTNRALATAERASAELRSFLNSSPSGMYLKDRDLNITLVNRAFETFYGKSAADIVNRPVREWMPKQLADEIDMLDLEVLRTGEHLSIEFGVKNAAGDDRIVEFNKYPILASDGEIVGIGGFNNDVTEQRLQAAEIEETQARLSAYFDHVPMIVVLLDRQSNIMMANSRYAEFFGIELQQAHADHSRFWLDDDIRKSFDRDNQQIFETGEVIERVVEMKNASGELRILHQVKFPINSDTGNNGVIGVFMSDITEQKLREKEIE